jgi:predicted O-methyltransferase YrrM/ribosomal protein S18 acetylase RimI-like enzyme
MSEFAAYAPGATTGPMLTEADGLSLRPARAEDLLRLAPIAAAREGIPLERALEGFERFFAETSAGHALLLIAELAGAAIGFGRASYFTPPPDSPPNMAPEGWYLAGVVVSPGSRRRGVGAALTEARLEWIAARSPRAYYFANERNQVTIDLHRAFGFVEATRDFVHPHATFEGGRGVLFVREREGAGGLSCQAADRKRAAPHDPTPTEERGPMSAPSHVDVDHYLSGLLAPHDDALAKALTSSTSAGLPEIQVSPTQGKFLHLLARLQHASAILEIGTLGGYSTIWLARALATGGKLISLEFDPKHAEVARANIARAGLSDRVEIRVGAALDALPKLEAEKAGPFDLVFIDADKGNNPSYFEWALKLTKRGSLIIIDNVVRDGSVLDAKSEDASIRGTRRALELMSKEPRVTATAIQTIGLKGQDGFAIALVTG